MKILFFLSLIFVFCGACTSVYLPNAVNAPMFTEKGQIHLEAHLSLKTNFSLQAAYALHDHFAVMVNTSSVDSEGRSKSLKQGLFEGGVGYFNTFDKEKHRVFELYLGVGKVNTRRISGAEIQKVDLQKVFLQGNFINRKTKDLKIFGKEFPLSYGTSLRFSFLNMHTFTIDGQNRALEDNTFFEPVFFTRLNLSKIVQLQYTTGTTLGFTRRNYLKAANSAMTFGIVFNFLRK